MTNAQKKALEMIKGQEIQSFQSDSRIGRTIIALIEAGKVGYRTRTAVPSERTYGGRFIPGAICYSGLHIIGE